MAPNGTNTYLDTLPEPEQRSALIKLIESLPTISSLKTSLDSGVPLTSLVRNKAVSDGAITVLRWVICSCRAYLKEVKPGQGVVNNLDAAASARYDPYGTLGGSGSSETIRQFTFVVGDPEQEDRFRKEIEIAKLGKPSLEQYPTMLAFHGELLQPLTSIAKRDLPARWSQS